ncbi:YihY/virulence factor BrkB family protein [Peribacillus frigoritolerans]|uniref:YihY/virulence factor BrkB family protein n=1 Tax=Peribacillus frigoritolerans TaxID=450367 RepID=UPI0010593569|nr:YihY/virulence factor BrkB family protein [Peribacillus frigoritolerans]TDL80840.1 YihY/virulence factor BrkB family protein [Peribacillus frigoritolerans]
MIKELIKRIQLHETGDQAAVLSHFFLLSLFPLLIFLVALLPYFNIETSSMVDIINQYAPAEAGGMLSEHLEGLINEPNGGLLSFGILATIWSASNATNALIRSLNKAFIVEETRPFWKIRLHAVIMTIGLVITFALTLVLPVFGSAIIGFVGNYFSFVSDNEIILNVMRFLISFLMMCAVLMVLYYLAPNEEMTLKGVYFGAIIATILWQLVSLGFAFYVSQFGNFNATYGSLGGVIVLITWLYLSGFAILIGGEINAIKVCERNGKKCV